MSRTLSGLLIAATLAGSLFVGTAMADSIHMTAPGFTYGGGGGSAHQTVVSGGGGGHQDVMNDDYYHTPKATDPGKKLNVLTAHDKPLDTSGYVAKDPGHKLNVLKASDTPRLQKVWDPARDMGAKKVKSLAKAVQAAYDAAHPPLPYCAQNGDKNCQVPYCGDAPKDIPCEPTDLDYSWSCSSWYLFQKYCAPK